MFNRDQLKGLNVVVYDAETKYLVGHVIDGKPITWNCHDRMGIASVVLYDYMIGEYRIYLDDNMKMLVSRLQRADLIVGFNHISFDNRLVEATFKMPLGDFPKNYDIKVESQKGAGVSPFTKGFKLDDHLCSTLGRGYMKTGDGAMAPELFQKGKIGELISYNMGDTRKTKQLFEHIWVNGWVKTQACGQANVLHPSELLKGWSK